MTTSSDLDKNNTFSSDRLDTRASLHELLSSRRSPRAFSDQPIEPWKIISIFEAARWSPSSANEQPWRFIVATKDDPDTFNALYESLMEGNRRWTQHVPMLVLGLAQTTYSRNGKPYQHAWYDLGQSVAHLTFQASALGLAVHQMGGFDAEKIRQLLAIPEGFEPVIVFAFGYAGSPAMLPEDLRRREEAPRSRKPLESFVYTEEWEKPSHHVQLQSSLLTQLPPNN